MECFKIWNVKFVFMFDYNSECDVVSKSGNKMECFPLMSVLILLLTCSKI